MGLAPSEPNVLPIDVRNNAIPTLHDRDNNMAKLVAIDHNTHKHIHIDPSKAELHGAELNLIPIVSAEFSNIAVQYPIVLTKNGETGEFVFTALLGFEANENLFWHQGQWQGIYLPLQVQRQPFFIGDALTTREESHTHSAPSHTSDYIVCIDLDSPTVITDSQPANADLKTLFTETGQDSEYFSQAKQRLAQLLQGERDNHQLLAILKQYDLLQPLSVEITFINEQSTRLNGLYTVNQEKLAALATEQIAELHQKNMLQPIYTMVTSLGQLYALIKRKNDVLSGE